MGTYYDVVCPEHKEVLHLWKADMLWGKLEYLAEKDKLVRERVEIDDDFSAKLIILTSPFFKVVIKEVPKSKQWLEEHKTCKLFFLDDEKVISSISIKASLKSLSITAKANLDSQKAFTQINK